MVPLMLLLPLIYYITRSPTQPGGQPGLTPGVRAPLNKDEYLILSQMPQHRRF